MKVLRWLDEHAEETLLVVLLAVITCSTGLQVVMRYLLNNSLTWSEEISRYSLVASGFLSIGYCIRKNVALRIDLVVNLLPRAVRIILSILCCLFMMWLFYRFILGAIPLRAKAIATDARTPALDIPFAYIYTFPVVGFLLAEVRLIQAIVGNILSLGRKPAPEVDKIELLVKEAEG